MNTQLGAFIVPPMSCLDDGFEPGTYNLISSKGDVLENVSLQELNSLAVLILSELNRHECRLINSGQHPALA